MTEKIPEFSGDFDAPDLAVDEIGWVSPVEECEQFYLFALQEADIAPQLRLSVPAQTAEI